MKKVKLHDIPSIHEALGKLINNHFPDFKTALRIAKVGKEIDTIKQSFTEQETAIMKKYMKMDRNGQFVVEEGHLVPIKNDEESIKKLNKELNDLHGTEVELETLSTPLVFTSMEGLEGVTPRDIMVLESIFEFNLEEPCHDGECEPPQENSKPVA